MVADTHGYHPLLDVYLDRVTVSSSLNDVRLLTTRCCKVSGCKCHDIGICSSCRHAGFREDAVPVEMGRSSPVGIQPLN
jgi:hypothetical protein